MNRLHPNTPESKGECPAVKKKTTKPKVAPFGFVRISLPFMRAERDAFDKLLLENKEEYDHRDYGHEGARH